MPSSQEGPQTGVSQICQIPWKLDSGGLEENLMVRWDQNQQDWIRWKDLYLEEEGGATFWQNYHSYSPAWRREQSNGVGLYGVEWSRGAHRGSGDHEWRTILWHFGWGSGGKLWKVGDTRGGGDISAGQKNNSKHTSKKATKWFEDNNIDIMARPAQSSDINPIEHLWVDLK